MTAIHLEIEQISNIKPYIKAAYPDYSGKLVKVIVTADKMRLTSYWDSGNRDYFCFVSLSQPIEVKAVPQNGSMFDRNKIDDQAVPANWLLIERSFRGSLPERITIYVNPVNAASLALPAPKEIPWAHMVVLTSMGLKNTYNGQSGMRRKESFRSTGITPSEYDQAWAELNNQGCFDRRGCLTPKGKTLRESMGFKQLHHLKRESLPLVEAEIVD
jgi:hypothetical protein